MDGSVTSEGEVKRIGLFPLLFSLIWLVLHIWPMKGKKTWTLFNGHLTSTSKEQHSPSELPDCRQKDLLTSTTSRGAAGEAWQSISGDRTHLAVSLDSRRHWHLLSAAASLHRSECRGDAVNAIAQVYSETDNGVERRHCGGGGGEDASKLHTPQQLRWAWRAGSQPEASSSLEESQWGWSPWQRRSGTPEGRDEVSPHTPFCLICRRQSLQKTVLSPLIITDAFRCRSLGLSGTCDVRGKNK